MTRRIVMGWAALGLLAGPAAADDPAPTGALVGRVVDLEGKPVADAEVWAKAWQDVVGRTRTDAEGAFRLEGLKDDLPITVWAAAEGRGLARERREDVRPLPGRDRDLGPIALAPGTVIAGRAVDAAGAPLAGAEVGLQVYHHVLGHTISSDQKTWELAADADGRFETPPLPPGAAAIVVAAPGKVRTRADKAIEPGTDRLDLGDLTLADEVPIRGVVVDGDGEPAPGVQVYAGYDYENIATTDAEGRFALGGHGPDAKEIRLQSNDYFAPEPFEIGPDRGDLRLEVIKAYTVLGSAVDAETGEPVPLDSVRLCRVERDPDDASVTLVG